MNHQVEIKILQIARMVVKGMKLTQVALEMGMSYSGLISITRRPEYLTVEEQVRNGVVGQMDARLAKRAQMETEVEDAVPEALQILLDGVRQKRDLKSALELLDRDPQRTFVKNKQAQPTASVGGTIVSSEALAVAVKDADVTHSVIEAQQQQTKPAEA